MRLPVWGRVLSGGAACSGGLALVVSAAVLFKRSGQDPAPWKPSPSMILRGPYRFTRKPMYVGMTLVTAGIGLALHDAWVVALASPALVTVHFTAVLPEEAYLTEKFADHYVRYHERVRRYL